MKIAEKIAEMENDIQFVKAGLADAFRMMNSYAKDPHNGKNWGRIVPEGVLAQVYMMIAPASIRLSKYHSD